jgi:Spy/CpxP family protein refolding chaperone
MILFVFGLALMLVPSSVPAQMGGMPDEGLRGGEMGMHEGMGMHEEMGMHEGMGMHEEMGMDGGMRGMMRMMMAINHLDLTPEQQKKIQTLRIQHQKEAIPLFGKIRMAGVEIEELLMAEPVNLDKVKAKTKEKYDAMADLEIRHLQLQQQIKAVLTPEQRKQLEEMGMKMGYGMERPMGHPMGKPGEMPMHPKMGMPAPGSMAPKTEDPHDR